MIAGIVLTPTEIAILLKLLDLAIKAGGFVVAESCLLFKKILEDHKAKLDGALTEEAKKLNSAQGVTPNVP